MDVTYGLLSNLVKTKSIERILAPIASQVKQPGTLQCQSVHRHLFMSVTYNRCLIQPIHDMGESSGLFLISGF